MMTPCFGSQKNKNLEGKPMAGTGGGSVSRSLFHVVAVVVVVVVVGALKNLESRQLFRQTVNEWSLLV